ncbi:glycoside hydrolase family 43 protein [Aplosporella prunicola CBS 121167]|uniref:Glycoside hydrolase family 43 protein n=1 Tax=Aplosporella prunicola CBS 121167 TaxID=1176127 RepID=A0A6A6AYU5_9PEZI|nr:glycoside hydrolase family 43 protein [Aplosporella prunicola CBS 121167]KAF2136174.1 glycoside hydrolase family 43 protein [Aplosporella prunicola CBS 121167]
MKFWTLLASFAFTSLSLLPSCTSQSTRNSSYTNPIFPGFHPDPSCIFVPEWNSTFFCATSSFLAFPGIPIYASRDLQNWKLIGNVLSRPEQLPELANTAKQTSGIWAPTIRYHNGTFYLATTLVHDDKDAADPARWDNIVFSSNDPYDASSWSDAVHFDFAGYDTSLFWDEDGQAYATGSHYFRVRPGMDQATIDLKTGDVGEFATIWTGTGGHAPEGPHVYKKDGYYYLMIAEGGTGVTHMETIARSTAINGPYTANPANPILTNANTTEYFQTVGHADLFQDASGAWWGVALATRSGPKHVTYPMGRESVLYPVTWDEGQWPVLSPVRGSMEGWTFPPSDTAIPGNGPFISSPDAVDFDPGSDLPLHFLHWRFPQADAYAVSPPGHPNSLRLKPSTLNLTGYDADTAPGGQTLIARRQEDTYLTFSVDLEFSPEQKDDEAGVTVFLTQNQHIDLGLVLLPTNGSLTPHLRLRSQSSNSVPGPVTLSLPASWQQQSIRMEIKATNDTHYAFSAGPTTNTSEKQTVGYVPASAVSGGFTGALVGVYATSNGGNGTSEAYVQRWRYEGQGQRTE